jgi:hypothetical protein
MTPGDADGLRGQLRSALGEARRRFSAEALPNADRILSLAGASDRPWDDLEPLERFLLFELDPGLAAQAGPDAEAAYCAALEALPGDWWGLPGRQSTPASRHLAALDARGARCLVRMMESATPLEFHSGEENALARAYGLTVGDAAAGALAAALGRTYDWRSEAAERREQRRRLRELLAGGANGAA